jgi:branched-chain amino acid transport system permease protein
MDNVLLQAIVVGVLTGGIYGLFAVGLSLIMGIANIMTFVHGDFLMIAMYLALGFTLLTNLDPYFAILVVVPAMFLLAVITYRFLPAVSKIVKLPQMKQMLYMLGFSYVLQNLVLMAFGAKFHVLSTKVTDLNMTIGDVFIAAPRLVAGIASILLTFGLMWVLNSTDLGRSIRAVSQDRNAAAAMGIDADKTYLLAWAIGLGLLGFGGPLLASIYSFYPLVGNFYLMIGFMCVVMGGLGNVVGALVGGLVMGVALELGNLYLPGSSGPILPFMVFILVLLLRPEGLFGESMRSAR